MPSELDENSGTSIDPMSSWDSNVTTDYSQTDNSNDFLVAQPSNSRPTTLNTGAQKDMYWFAHAADPPQEKPKRNMRTSSPDQDDGSVKRGDVDKESPTDTSSRSRGILNSSNFESKEDASPQAHKDREERIRHFKERLEEDRSRRLQEMEIASVHAQKLREQQEEERKRKIEELRVKDLERRYAVEERKRQILEAEQERKEAILRRNLDREAKIEAKRNSQRSSIAFAFGSSTPRTLDLEPGYVHYYRTAGNGIVVANRKSFEDREVDYYKRRPPSADISDSRQEESLSPREFDELVVHLNSVDLEAAKEHVKQPYYRRSFAGMSSDETKACLTMTDNSFDSPLWANHMPDLGFFSHSGFAVGEDLMTRSMVSLSSSAARGRRRTDLTPTMPLHRDLSLQSSSVPTKNQAKRAVSMSRLDLLSQPRRRIVDTSSSSSTVPNGSNNTSMSKSMFNLANNRRVRKGVGGSNGDTGSGMSRSMMHLASTPPSPPPRSTSRTKKRPQSVPLSQSSKQLSKSMVHLTPPPRPNRATQLRALAAARKDGPTSSSLVVNQIGIQGLIPATGTPKEASYSPSRPRSSMSLASEKSATSSYQSSVSMRVRSAPRRPRPVSIAGTVPDMVTPPQPPPRQSRTSERKATPSTPPTRPNRAKSANAANETDPKPETKPPPVPKPIAKVQPPISDKVEVTNSDPPNELPLQNTEEAADDNQQKGSPANKSRITSEEAAKAALAEKRRLAREQAEKEAELERQRQEQLRREEEEKRRKEEEEQRRMEDEHARLVEALRQQEEEKLKKAIEEQQKLEEEQRLLREEEAKQKAEREEQEKKAKEEAEKQRKELEEKLIKEEAERAERKKRVEQIMKRTRGKSANQGTNGTVKSESNSDSEKYANAEESAMTAASQEVNGLSEQVQNKLHIESQPLPETEEVVALSSTECSTAPVQERLDYDSAEAAAHAATVNNKNERNTQLDSESLVTLQPVLGNVIVEPVTKVELSSDPFGSLNLTQTNGYSSEETHFKQNISHEEKINPLVVDNLLDFDSLSSNANEKVNTSPDFNGLADFGSAANTATNQNNNFLSNIDDVNLNRTSANPFISFEENANITPESTVTDLLS